MMRSTFLKSLLGIILLLMSLPALADVVVSGRVLDKVDGSPLPGASVLVPSEELLRIGAAVSSLGTTTDGHGNFTLTVPDGVRRVEVQFIGFERQMIALTKDRTKGLTIRLSEASTAMSEVVVTGYQKIDRRKLTASVQKVNVSENMVGAAMSIDQALAGQIAGLASVTSTGAPGASPKIRIRGTASLSGTQDPLWVLDGIPLEGTELPSMDDLKDIDNIYSSSIAGVNPSDIESITVLKDAAATAIYGARAANGVIVITTKQGKAGRTNISFSTRQTWSPKTNIDRLNLLTSDQKVDLELGLLQSDYTYRENKGEVARILAATGETAAFKANGWGALTAQTQDRINALRSVNTDWNDILFRSTYSQEYNFSISGGDERATFYTAVGYQDELGNVVGVEANRLNLTAKTQYQVTPSLKLGASLFANRRVNKSNLTDTDGFTNPVYYSRRANPYQSPFDANGNYVYDTDIQGRGDSDLQFNIFEERVGTSYELETKSLTALFDGELKLTDNLRASTQLGLQIDDGRSSKFASHDTYAMRKDKERTTLAVLGNTSFLPDGGKKSTTNTTNRQLTWKLQGEWSQSFAEIHECEAMVGTEIRKTWYESVGASAYGYDEKTLQTKPVLYPSEQWAQYYPLYTESQVENAFASFFGTASYTLMRRYTLGGSVRADGSDMFGVAKKYRFLPLYSVSGLWRVTQEPFMRGLRHWLDNMNLRVSYGVQGNIDKSTSSYVLGDYRNVTILPGNTEEIIQVSSPPNSKLRWEKTHTLTLGLDLSLFSGGLNFSVDYYQRRSSDLIATKMLALESGFSSMLVNWASMRNQGIEIALGTRNIHTKSFTWMTNINFAYNANKVTREEIPENQTTPGREGYPVGALFALRSAGLDAQGYPLFYNPQGEVVTATQLLKLNGVGASTLTAAEQRALYSYIGSTDPLYTGGFINTFRYKGWELSLNFVFNLGMYVRCQPSYNPCNFDRGMNVNTDILNRWTVSNPSGTFPRLMNSSDRPAEYIQYSEFALYEMSDIWVRRADHCRLQNVRLGYTFPEKWLKPIGLAGVEVAAEARNLVVFGADYKNYLDPETMGNPFAQPIPKQVSLNLKVNF